MTFALRKSLYVKIFTISTLDTGLHGREAWLAPKLAEQ